MRVRCFCPKHGKLDFGDIMVRNNKPFCMKCRKLLEFVDVDLKKVALKK